MNIQGPLRGCIPLLLCLGTAAEAQDNQKQAPSLTIRQITIDIKLEADGKSTQTIHSEMRAGNDAGAQQVGQSRIAYDAAGEDMTVVEAHTLKADGKTVPVDAGAIYDQSQPGADAGMVTGLRSKLIIFPQFAAGDTAVYTVARTVKHPSFENQFFYSSIFLKTVAYDEVRETITAPKSFPLYAESHDVDFTRREDGANITYSWRYAAPTPVADVPLTMMPLDHTPRFFVSSFKDYAQLGRAYATLVEPKKIVTPKIQALADEITAGTSDPKAQAQKLYEWVNSHIRYVAIELGTGSFTPHDVDVIAANGYGDCKDHDLLLQTLLKAKGVESQSILINGGATYSMTEVATFATIDHVITFLPRFNLYLDSSAGGAPFGVLPLQEYGKQMVVAAPASPGLGKMPVLAPGVAKTIVKTVAALDKDGALTGTTITAATGPYAISLRAIGLAIQAVGPTAGTRALTAQGYANPTGSFTQDSPTGFSPDYAITGTFKVPGYPAISEILGGKKSFYIPGGMRLFSLSGDKVMGPFDPPANMKPGEPMLCFSAQQSEDLSLKAPAGYQFNGLPSDKRIETPNILFTAHWAINGDTISVHRDFTSKIDQPFCTGTVLTQSAAAIKQIANSYNDGILFSDRGKNGDGAASASSVAMNFYNSGVSNFNANSYALAIADLDKAVTFDPKYYFSYSYRGSAYAKLGQYDRAIADFDQAIKLRQDDYSVYSQRGFAHQALGHQALAAADYSQAIVLKSDDAASYSNRGLAELNQNQLEAAITDFNKAIALMPDSPDAFDAYYGRGWARGNDHPDMALADLDKAIAIRPDAAQAYGHRGAVKENLHRYADAIADFDKILTMKPGDIDALAELGRLHAITKNYTLAIAEYGKVLAQKPDDPNILAGRGFAYLRAGQYKLAIADYDKVIAQKPDASDAFLNRGSAKNKLGQKKEGEQDIAIAVKLDPSLGK
ncbi:MAG TPA: tetratricopeptide repeat protein [Rhizomicrobium sp.]|jgi:tetratricopeptide (TPR) repeat protein/transglutaminase-like putative cysteine protease